MCSSCSLLPQDAMGGGSGGASGQLPFFIACRQCSKPKPLWTKAMFETALSEKPRAAFPPFHNMLRHPPTVTPRASQWKNCASSLVDIPKHCPGFFPWPWRTKSINFLPRFCCVFDCDRSACWYLARMKPLVIILHNLYQTSSTCEPLGPQSVVHWLWWTTQKQNQVELLSLLSVINFQRNFRPSNRVETKRA